MTIPPEDRSPFAIAYAWVSRVITVALVMVIPGVLGIWLDSRLGTWIAFTLVGFAFGLGGGVWLLILLTRAPP